MIGAAEQEPERDEATSTDQDRYAQAVEEAGARLATDPADRVCDRAGRVGDLSGQLLDEVEDALGEAFLGDVEGQPGRSRPLVVAVERDRQRLRRSPELVVPSVDLGRVAGPGELLDVGHRGLPPRALVVET